MDHKGGIEFETRPMVRRALEWRIQWHYRGVIRRMREALDHADRQISSGQPPTTDALDDTTRRNPNTSRRQ